MKKFIKKFMSKQPTYKLKREDLIQNLKIIFHKNNNYANAEVMKHEIDYFINERDQTRLVLAMSIFMESIKK